MHHHGSSLQRLLRKSATVGIAIDCGVVGITQGHNDGATFPMLRAIRSGLDAAKIEVPSRLTRVRSASLAFQETSSQPALEGMKVHDHVEE